MRLVPLMGKSCSTKRNGLKINIKAKASDFKVPYTTLHGRFHNIHKPRVEAHVHQQFLSASLEKVLVLWIKHLGSTGFPLCKRAIKTRAQHLHPDNKKPSANWIYTFLKRHPDISLSSSSGLDPKRAKAFNKPVVNRFFDELSKIIEENVIPPENIYNMDEKGCQRGGGKKSARRKYFYSRKQRSKYRLRSANLELITIIEAIYKEWDKAWEKHRGTINCLIWAFLTKLLTNISQLFLPSVESLCVTNDMTNVTECDTKRKMKVNV
jgi:hypothetical protein